MLIIFLDSILKLETQFSVVFFLSSIESVVSRIEMRVTVNLLLSGTLCLRMFM